MASEIVSTNHFILSLGVLLLVGLACHELGSRTQVPRVTLLLVAGALAGPNTFNLISPQIQILFPAVSQIALCMVGFLLGEQFVYQQFSKYGRLIWSISIIQTLVTVLSVLLVLWWIPGIPLPLALLLAGISASTAPAATIDVIREKHYNSELANTVLKVVAIDDALGIVIFGVFLSIAQVVGEANGASFGIQSALWETFGAILIGAALGWPMAMLAGRINKGEPTLIEALGFVLLCGGMAEALDTSYLLASITMGAVVANFSKHYDYPFNAIEGISTPLLIIFFFMAGFQFDASAISAIGLLGLAYILARSAGKVIGGYFGAAAGGADRRLSHSIGWCLLPQAGVALGLALMAADTFPNYSSKLLSILVGTTIIFELFGPLITQRVLLKDSKEKVTAES